MRRTIICCPFKTSFGSYASSLKEAIEKKTGDTMQWVGSNCGCGDPIEVGKQFQIIKTSCEYFEMPIVMDYPADKSWKRPLRSAVRSVLLHARAKRYAKMSKNAEVVHFQQILNAYGSTAVFSWLQRPSSARRFVTIHELDAEQLEAPEKNKTYNLADGIIVHCEEMKQQLVRLGVQSEKIHVVLHGTTLPTPLSETREGIVFYGGHKLMSSKGIETVFKAMAMLKQQMGTNTPVLKIHGHYGTTVPEAALQLATKYGVADKILWLNQLLDEEMIKLYQHSLLCVLPYTGSFAGSVASLAAACQLPVVCTRKAGLPEHLGTAGIWVDENSPEQLVERITELLGNERLRTDIGAQLLKRAKTCLGWDVIADQTLKIYAS
jgi:glycosyltransferase involved in cell wall biosynthesis